MFVKLLIALILIGTWSGTMGFKNNLSDNINNNEIITKAVMLDKKIVEYYLAHSNQLPASENGCISISALTAMGFSGCEEFRDKNKFFYSVNGNGTFTLSVITDKGVFTTANSDKVLPFRAKEDF